MRVLWITNIQLPEVSKLLNEDILPLGGWMVNASKILSNQKNIKLYIACPKKGIKELEYVEGNNIGYYLFTPVDDKSIINKKNNLQLEKLLVSVKPDIVHVFGTEYGHSLQIVRLCEAKGIKSVVNIQGMISVYYKHYMANIPSYIGNRFTFRDFIRQDNIRQQKKKFYKKGKFEIETIKNVKHVIGRTDWDKACTIQINQQIKYHFCNETLREIFYERKWNIKDCERHSIFLSQAGYPIKGLHFMLEAMPYILDKFPNAKIYISGQDITKSQTIKDKIKITSYAKYIRELINRLGLQDKVIFTGLLDENQMCERFLKSNVFVSPSIIENESNSLSEAKLLGVPSVSSYVGGVTGRLNHKESGFFYPANEPYMMAYYICKIFENDELAMQFSKKSRIEALETHDKDKNVKNLIRIYDDIITN